MAGNPMSPVDTATTRVVPGAKPRNRIAGLPKLGGGGRSGGLKIPRGTTKPFGGRKAFGSPKTFGGPG